MVVPDLRMLCALGSLELEYGQLPTFFCVLWTDTNQPYIIMNNPSQMVHHKVIILSKTPSYLLFASTQCKISVTSGLSFVICHTIFILPIFQY